MQVKRAVPAPAMKSKASLLGLLLAASLSAADNPAPSPNAPAPSPAVEAAEEQKPEGTKSEQLAAAQKQLSILKLRYTEKHPAVLKQRAKVARLQQDVRTEEKQKGPVSKSAQISAAKEELVELQKKFTDEHPRVKALKRQIAELEQQR